MSAREFEMQLRAEWAAKTQEASEFVQEVGFAVLRGVVQMSPVDTGRFKGNWIVSIGGMDHSTTERVDPSGAATLAKGAAAIEAYPDGLFPMLYVQNNLPYAVPLETGHSKQAPAGMAGITVSNVAAHYASRQI